MVQVTIELPDKFARDLEPERAKLAEIIVRGLRSTWSNPSAIRRELLGFLAQFPTPDELLAFRPSETAVERMRELLERNRQNALTPAEEAELDEMAELDHLVTFLKAEAWKRTRART